jgi:hypothetical protein
MLADTSGAMHQDCRSLTASSIDASRIELIDDVHAAAWLDWLLRFSVTAFAVLTLTSFTLLFLTIAVFASFAACSSTRFPVSSLALPSLGDDSLLLLGERCRIKIEGRRLRVSSRAPALLRSGAP